MKIQSRRKGQFFLNPLSIKVDKSKFILFVVCFSVFSNPIAQVGISSTTINTNASSINLHGQQVITKTIQHAINNADSKFAKTIFLEQGIKNV